jgi:hypothetical protein
LTKRIPGVVTIAEDGHTRKVAQRSLEIVENHIRAGPIIKCPNGAIIELGQLGKPNSEPFARGGLAGESSQGPPFIGVRKLPFRASVSAPLAIKLPIAAMSPRAAVACSPGGIRSPSGRAASARARRLP